MPSPHTTHCWFINRGLASATLISSAIFLLVNTGLRSLFIFFPRSESCLRTVSADLWSLNGRIIRTGALAWTSRTCSWFCDSLNRAHRLSSSPDLFAQECDNLKVIFLKLKYPERLINSTITRFLRDAHNQLNKDLQKQFTILKKCHGKLECLIYKMLFIKDKKPKLNTQSDSIKAKLFT